MTAKEAWSLIKKQLQETKQNKKLFEIIENQLNKTYYEVMVDMITKDVETAWGLGTEEEHIKNHFQKTKEKES
jgi:hypothetical protein